MPINQSNVANNVVQFAATPILVRDVVGREESNRKLCEYILAKRAESPDGDQRTNRGGWQSPVNFLETMPPELRSGLPELFWNCICEILQPTGVNLQSYKARVTGWANVSMQGGFNVPHQHPNGIWSAVYYLSGDMDAGGELHIMDPRPQASVLKNALCAWGGDLVFKPRNSSIIVFPSWLVHFVTPYTGASPRINVAFNCA